MRNPTTIRIAVVSASGAAIADFPLPEPGSETACVTVAAQPWGALDVIDKPWEVPPAAEPADIGGIAVVEFFAHAVVKTAATTNPASTHSFFIAIFPQQLGSNGSRRPQVQPGRTQTTRNTSVFPRHGGGHT
jgi:hypothetical protein